MKYVSLSVSSLSVYSRMAVRIRGVSLISVPVEELSVSLAMGADDSGLSNC